MRSPAEAVKDWPEADVLTALADAIWAPIPGHVVDQYHAASRDAGTALASAGGVPGLTERHMQALFITATVQRMSTKQRGPLVCPHAQPSTVLTQPQPLVLQLGVFRVGCASCWRGAPKEERDEDGLCDFCQEPTDLFTFWAACFGAMTIQGDLCDRCVREIGDLAKRPRPS